MSAPKLSDLFGKFKAPDAIAPDASTRDTTSEPEAAEKVVSQLESLFIAPPPLPPAVAAQTFVTGLREDAKFWGELSTRLWRADRQLRRLNESEPSDGIERLTRRFEEVFEALRDHDIEILDHTGEKYDAGMTLKVLQFEPQDGIKDEVIVETVKPSVRLKGVFVPGEVVVATPREYSQLAPPIEAGQETTQPTGEEPTSEQATTQELTAQQPTTDQTQNKPENHEPQHD